MTAEAALHAALAAAPPSLRLWWRDDDAGRPHPRLARLLALAERRAAPVALAVVPAWLEAECALLIGRCPWASVLQHGIAHRNHAREGERKIELSVTDSAKRRLADAGYDPSFGARPLKRTIQRMIQDPLALGLLEGRFAPGDTVMVDDEGGGVTLRKGSPVPQADEDPSDRPGVRR